MTFTTIGITAIHLLFAKDAQLKKFYSLMSGLSKRDVDTLISTLVMNKKSLSGIKSIIDTKSKDYLMLSEDINEFKKNFFNSDATTTATVDDLFDSFFEDELTFEFTDKQESELIENKEVTSEMDNMLIFSSNAWRSNIKKSEDMLIVENHYKDLKERHSKLPRKFECDRSSDELLCKYDDRFLIEIQNNIFKTDEIVAEIYKNSGKVTEVLNIPVYSDYYYSRKGIFKLVSTTYSNALPSKIDESLSEISAFLSGDTIKITNDMHEELEFYIDKYCIFDTKGNKSSKTIKNNKLLMSVLNEFFTLLYEMEENIEKSIYFDGLPDLEIQNRVAVDLAERYSIVGYIPNALEVLIKNVYYIYQQKGKRRELSVGEIRVFQFIKMALVSIKYGFRR